MSRRANVSGSSRFQAEALEPRRLLSAGNLDPTFGVGGKASLTSVFTDATYGVDVATQIDGKIVALANTYHDVSSLLAVVVRVNQDGSLDRSFGSGDGMVALRALEGRKLLLQPDGKILVGLTINYDQFGVERLNADGSIDRSFGKDGFATIDTRTEDLAGMALQTDGKILLGGDVRTLQPGRYDFDFLIARFTADGHPDEAFGGNGVVTTDFANRDDRVRSLTVLGDGRIVAAGVTNEYAGGMACYLPDGELDATFGDQGRLAPARESRGYYPYDVVASANGGFYSAGWDHRVEDLIVAARHLPDGSLDPTFHDDGVSDGVAVTSVADADLHLHPDGSIYVSGSVFVNGDVRNLTPVFEKLKPDGALDDTFREHGHAFGIPGVRALAFTPNGHLLTVDTYSYFPVDPLHLELRLVVHEWDEGYTPDPTFGGGTGVVGIGVPHGSFDVARDIAIQADGKVLLAGTWSSLPLFSSFEGGAIVRFNADGSPDLDFGRNGVSSPEYNDDAEEWDAVAVQRDGRILIGGAVVDGFHQPTRLLARLNADGSLDTTFGVNGFVTRGRGEITELSILRDGTFLALDKDQFARCSPDGALVSTFGDHGVVAAPSLQQRDVAFNVLPDGRFYFLLRDSGSVQNRYLYRFNADGSLDSSFTLGGQIGAWPSSTIPPRAMAVDSDGRIVVVGTIQPFDSTQPLEVYVARFMPSGEFDPALGLSEKRVEGLDWDQLLVNAVAVDSNGRILIGGHGPQTNLLYEYEKESDFRLARLRTDGSLDASFGTNGVIRTDFDGGADILTTLAVLPDGSILAGGSATVPPSDPILRRTQDFALAKYTRGGLKAVAGGRYAAPEGGQVVLDGSRSTAGDAAIVGYEWDFDYDGNRFDVNATGVSPTFSAAGLDGPSTRVVALRVRDVDAGVSIAEANVAIVNAPPTLTRSFPSVLTEGSRTLLNLTATDPSDADRAAGLRFDCDFNDDGTFDLIDVPASAVFIPPSAVPDGPATVSMRLRVRDRDGGSNDYPLTFSVTNAPPTASLAGSATVESGATAVVRFASPRDPSPVDLASLRYSFDFDDDGVFDSIGDSPTVTVPAGYLSAFGQHVIHGKIEDKDGGSSPTASFTVKTVAPQTSVQAAADASVRDGFYETTSFGVNTDLHVGASTQFDGTRWRAFMRFDLTDLRPATAAKLRLRGAVNGSTQLALYASPDHRLWKDAELTWANQLPLESGPIDTQLVAGLTLKLYEWDVTDCLKGLQSEGVTTATFALVSVDPTAPDAEFFDRSADVAFDRPTLVVAHDVPAVTPGVVSVTVSSPTWKPSFLDYLRKSGLGDVGGFIVPTVAATLPWTNLNQVSVRFDQPVRFREASLQVRSPFTVEYAVITYRYDAATYTATWTLERPLAPGDRVRIEAPGVAVPNITFLAGDVDGNKLLNASDLVLVRNRIGRTTVQAGAGTNAYDPRADLNGDGAVNATDLVLLRNRIGGATSTIASTFSRVAIIPRNDSTRSRSDLLDRQELI